MLVTVKILQGKECKIEVSAAMSVHSVKERLATVLDIPANQQKLIFRGKTLTDGQILSDYTIVDGSKIHLVVRQAERESSKKESQTFWDDLLLLLRKHYSVTDSDKILEQFKKNHNSSITSYSLEDLERLADYNLNEKIAEQGSSHQSSDRSSQSCS